MNIRVGDRVVGTDKSWEHRIGELGTVTVCKGDNIWVLWDGEEMEHLVFKNEILRLKEKPMQKDNTPKIWRDMTPEEKGALLLGWQQGKVIEAHDLEGDWFPTLAPSWFNQLAYRIKPEPKRETLKLYGKNGWYDPAIGTIDLIDGKPDPSSIKIWGV